MGVSALNAAVPSSFYFLLDVTFLLSRLSLIYGRLMFSFKLQWLVNSEGYPNPSYQRTRDDNSRIVA